RLDRTAVEQPKMRTLRAKPFNQLLTHESMSSTHVLHRWRQTCTDCPYRLISDDCILRIHAIRQGTRQLRAYNVQRALRLALIGCLADAHDCDQTGSPGGFSFGANDLIAFVMIGPALRMTDNDMRRACFLEHLGRDIASMRTRYFMM